MYITLCDGCMCCANVKLALTTGTHPCRCRFTEVDWGKSGKMPRNRKKLIVKCDLGVCMATACLCMHYLQVGSWWFSTWCSAGSAPRPESGHQSTTVNWCTMLHLLDLDQGNVMSAILLHLHCTSRRSNNHCVDSILVPHSGRGTTVWAVSKGS